MILFNFICPTFKSTPIRQQTDQCNTKTRSWHVFLLEPGAGCCEHWSTMELALKVFISDTYGINRIHQGQPFLNIDKLLLQAKHVLMRAQIREKKSI